MKYLDKITGLIIIFVCIQFNGCAVIHFENGDVIADPNKREFLDTLFVFGKEEKTLSIDPGSSIRFSKWYHHGFYQVAEISNPLDLNRVCTGLDWNQVTTQTDPVDTLISLADNIILIPAASAGIDLWSHWNIEYSCRYQ
tara:strand:+ start:5260 stop:5679 length:420 start_codon:yes stop_codon:yes gene_type:complete